MKKLLSLFFVSTIVIFASCKKDDPQPEAPAQPADLTEQLANTSWMSELQGSYTYSGVDMQITMTSTLDFLENKEGELFVDVIVSVPSMPDLQDQEQSETISFTYTFDGTNLALIETYVDDETGQTLNYTTNGVYDKESDTMTIDFDDSEMVEMFGTDMMVFSRMK